MIEGGGLGFYLLLGLLFLVFLYSTRRATRRPPLQGDAPAEEALQAPPLGTDWGRGLPEASEYLENIEILQAIEAIETAHPAREPLLDETARDARRLARGTGLAQPSGAGRAARTRRMLGSRQGLRDAMVLMTVLGPCRTLSPYDASAEPSGPPQPLTPRATGVSVRRG